MSIIDQPAFLQILELDDDGAHAYSKDMIKAYFAQASDALKEMQKALTATDLKTLTELAHFFMGSSATLGTARVAAACADVVTALKDVPPEGAALAHIGALLAVVNCEYADAEAWLRRWYANHGESFEEVESALPESESESDSDATPRPAPSFMNAPRSSPRKDPAMGAPLRAMLPL
ncbi:signal transduction histidine kinase [Mycena epipterygia]|nr:signal transduction histidine kinase [Mycena epipterygia]